MHHRWPGPSPNSGSSPGGNVDLPVVDDRRGDDVVAVARAAALPHRRLGVAVELPEQFRLAAGAGFRPKAVDPAVAAGEDRLRHSAEHGKAGDDHWPSRMFSPGELSAHTSLPVRLSRAMKLGAWGAGTRLCSSSVPLDVFTSSRSPAAVTEQVLMFSGATPNSLIMSKIHTMSASSQLVFGSDLYGPSLRRS